MWFQINPDVVGGVDFKVLEAETAVGDEVIGRQRTIAENRATQELAVVYCGLQKREC